MKRLSADGVWFGKNVWAPLWFAVLAWMAWQAAFGAKPERGMLLPLVLLAILGTWAYLRRVNVADSVDDAGDALVVRRGRLEERIALRSIREVEYRGGLWPRVVLRTDLSSRFGDEIVFVPHNPMPFAHEGPMLRQLRERIVQAHAPGASA